MHEGARVPEIAEAKEAMPLRGPIVAIGVAVMATVAASAPHSGEPTRSAASPATWTEVTWPFLMDQWGKGRAFQCKGGDCGRELNLYVRPKIGFCNCTTGVADDAELDRVGDVELISQRFAPRADGQPIAVGWMKGRSRAYAVADRGSALALAFNDRCDVVVVTVAGGGELPAGADRAAIEFLNSQPFLRWVEVSLGL